MGSIEVDGDLPHGDSPNLELVPATPEEHLESIRLNSHQWKGPLTTDQYFEREHVLGRQKLTRNGGITCWILVDQRYPPNSRTILASCETIRKDAFLAYQGRVEDVITHGIGSVFVRPEFRGRGYAGRMIHELGKKLDTWQVEEQTRKVCLFSVLYSDIGKKFYSQYGWKPFPSSHLTLPPISRAEYNRELSDTPLPEARDLTAEDVKVSICSDKVIQKQRELLRVVSEKSPTAKVAIAPDYDHMVWHWAREQFYESQSVFPKGCTDVKGAGVDSANVYCTWTRVIGDDPNSHTLYILRWMYDEPTNATEERALIQAVAAVLRRAQLQAKLSMMSKVDFWNPAPLLEKATLLLDPSAQIVHRESSSITSLKWNGAEHGLGDEVEWVWNEKYSWC